MSLDTLLEAAKYLDKIEANGDVSTGTNPSNKHLQQGPGPQFPQQIYKQIQEGGRNGQTESIPIPSGHLRLDPNLPISFHFHTYSSQAPASVAGPAGAVSAGGCLSFPVKSTNVKNPISAPSHTEAGSRQMMVFSSGSGGSSSSGCGSGSGGGRHSFSGTASNGNVNSVSRGGRGSRSSSGSTGDEKDAVAASNRHRELHKTLEKNRRAHLRYCFEQLKQELPKSEYSDKKTSHINIIHCAIKYIQCLKRSELDAVHEMDRLARTKARYQTQLGQLRDDLVQDDFRAVDIDALLRDATEQALMAGAVAAAAAADTGDRDGGAAETAMSVVSSEGGGGGGHGGVIVDGISPVGGYMDDENSEGEVIVDLEAGQDYDDETTTTASECADDVRDGMNSSASSFNGVTNSSFLSQCHA